MSIMEGLTPNLAVERIGKADDCRISERQAHIQLTSFNLHTILGMPEVKGMVAPIVPAVMPRSVTEADKLQVLEDGGLLGSCASLTEMAEGDGLQKAQIAFAWLEGLREEVNARKQMIEESRQVCSGDLIDSGPHGLTRVSSKGRRMSKPTPQEPAKKLRIVVHPPMAEHDNPPEIRSAPLEGDAPKIEITTVCPSKRTAELKGEPLPAGRSLRLSASMPMMRKSRKGSHQPSTLSESLQQRGIKQLTGVNTRNGERTHSTNAEPRSTEQQAHLDPTSTLPASSQAPSVYTPPPTSATFVPASPPPSYLSPRSYYAPIHQPFHWTTHLSTTLHTWFSHPDTKALQHPIQELTLTASVPQPWGQEPAPPGGARLLSQFEGVVRNKMKFMRILLPHSVSQEFADRDWIVISCTQRPAPAALPLPAPTTRPSTSVLRPRIISPPTSPSLIKTKEEVTPYFLLALPVSALRTWSVTCPHSASLAPPMVEPVYPFDSPSYKHVDNTPKDPATRPHRTRMLVHSPGVLPLVH
ncbi:hypothetical protein LTR95_018421, partial [Oleoguttula sp. CCFEE 5521]